MEKVIFYFILLKYEVFFLQLKEWLYGWKIGEGVLCWWLGRFGKVCRSDWRGNYVIEGIAGMVEEKRKYI